MLRRVPAVPEERWIAERDRLRCLIRRAQPTSVADLRLFLSAASRLLRWAEAQGRQGSFSALLDESCIHRCLAEIDPESTRKFYRARMRRLLVVAHDLPRHRRKPRTARAPLSKRLVALKETMEKATPLVAEEMPRASASDFRRIIATLPKGDVAAFEEQVRG